MKHSPRILLVDDDQAFLRLLSMRLDSEGYETQAATSGEQALALVPTFQPELIITDLRMDGMDGMTLFDRLHESNTSLPVMILTAHGSIPHAIEATQRGAFSYLTKPFESADLLKDVARALTLHAGPTADADEEGEVVDEEWCKSIITRNPVMHTLLSQARRAAATDVSILIQSESGTGKELLARAIHDASKRADQPFLALNCSAVPEALLESELFGHAKGAFTGATRKHDGLFQAAEGGTLFLDEVGDMPLGFQAKLLRALQEKEVRPVGSTQGVTTDVRIVAATHRDLAAEVAQKRFREDLYYRLNVIQLEIPPLRERREDIPLLADHFLQDLASADDHTQRKHFAPEAMELLVGAAWPGNVRQLRNIVEQTTVLSPTSVVPASQVQQALKSGDSEIPPLAEARERFERRYLVEILQITEGNVTQAAQLAKRNRTEFYKLLNRHHIDPHQFRVGSREDSGAE